MTGTSVTALSSTTLRRSKGRKVRPGDDLLVRYQGQLLTGEQFDANFDFSDFEAVPGREPFEFTLGAGDVIQGWDQGLEGARIGEVRRLLIPADLAYGASGAGDRIPPNSDLDFIVEPLAVRPGGSGTAVFQTFKDFGIKTRKIGLTAELLASYVDIKIGLDGADAIEGGDEADLLIGLKGKDQLTGGLGADVLIGGKDKDTLIYRGVKESPAQQGRSDHLLGFHRKDRIDLSAVAKELQFIGRDRFSGTAGDVRFNKERLELDKDGDGSADLALLMPGVKSLKPSNLIL